MLNEYLKTIPDPDLIHGLDLYGAWVEHMGNRKEEFTRLLSDPTLSQGYLDAEFSRWEGVFEANSSYSMYSIDDLMSALPALRYRLLNGRMFQLRETLISQLDATDINESMPSQYFRLPYSFIYVQFGTSPIEFTREGNVFDLLYGVYIQEYINTDEGFKLHANRPVSNDPERAYAFTLVTSSAFDTDIRYRHNVPLLLPENADLLIGSAIEAQLEARNHIDAFKLDQPYLERRKIVTSYVMNLIAKMLLYLSIEEKVTEELNPEAGLKNKLLLKKKSKKGNLQKKLRRKLPYILLGAKHAPVTNAVPGNRSVKSHFRRGHFRNVAHGPQHSLRKLKWIQPTMVTGKDLVGAEIKSYQVK